MATLYVVKAWQPGQPEVAVQSFTDRAAARRVATRRNRHARKRGAATRYLVRQVTT
jgi:hypothetical protein